MKLNFKVGFAVFPGILTASYCFHLAHWGYRPFDDPFDFPKALVWYGLQIVDTMIWFWITGMVFKSGSS